MNWPDFLKVLRCRAIEEADGEGRVWNGDARNSASREAKQAAGRSNGRFLNLRSAILLKTVSADSFAVPSIPRWAVTGGWLLALIFGWMLGGIGQEQEINLLSLPLIGLLLWNVTVIVISLFASLKKSDAPPPSWITSLLDRFAPKSSEDKLPPAAMQRFRELALPPAMRRLGARARAWLHIGAALLAFGSCAAMYAHGWSKEYLAVWESTLLDDGGARTFFKALFGPAWAITGVPIPLDDLPSMRRGIHAPASRPGPALPWIHLYAATLALGIILPRVLFATLELWRASRVADQVLGNQGWQRYIAHLMRDAAPRGDENATLIIHASGHDDERLSRWRHAVLDQWKEVGEVTIGRVTSGDEDEFLTHWKPSTPWLAFASDLATTPEEEVQGVLLKGLIAKHRAAYPSSRMVALLDGASLVKRWKGMADLDARLVEKAALWKRVIGEPSVDVSVLGPSGLKEV